MPTTDTAAPPAAPIAAPSPLSAADDTRDPAPPPPSPRYGASLDLSFKGKPIRGLMVNGVPWFVLSDLVEAMGYGPRAADVVNRADFPSFAKMIAMEEPDPDIPGEPADVVILSPVGVWYWTEFTDAYRGQGLAAWARREAQVLCPNPQPGDPSVFLTLQQANNPNGFTLPPYPAKFSGRRSEFLELRDGACAFALKHKWTGWQRQSPPPASSTSDRKTPIQ